VSRRLAAGRILGLGVVTAALAQALAACGTPSPTPDTSKALHLESRIDQAVVVGLAPPASGARQYTNVLPACGGRLDLVVGREIPSSGTWLVGLGIDPSRQLDAALPTWSGNPDDLPHVHVALIWSRNDIRADSLPQWVTVTPEGTVQASAPPTDPMPSPCPSLVVPNSP
jgi:hypothetical protein